MVCARSVCACVCVCVQRTCVDHEDISEVLLQVSVVSTEVEYAVAYPNCVYGEGESEGVCMWCVCGDDVWGLNQF